MSITNKLKVQLDLPVWEWCRFAPVSTSAISSLAGMNAIKARYLYYQRDGSLYRYDTYTDSWQQLTTVTNLYTPTVMNTSMLSNDIGHYGRAIGPGAGLNTIQLAGLNGNCLVGQKIRIINGTGAGQERTISSVSAPIIAYRGTVTTGGTGSITDATTGVGLKQWKINQWRNYQVRVDFGTGRQQFRPILYNTATALQFSDTNWLTVYPWAAPIIVTTPATNAQYVIESHIATVDTNWTTPPDSTSQFVILSGGIWNATQGTTSAPFFAIEYYNILGDFWYGKSTQTNLKTAVFTAASDLKLEALTEIGGALLTGTVSAATARSITVSGGGLTPMSWANMEVRITAGTGIGQTRSILTNTATVINVVRDWDITPSTDSSFAIYRDVGKLWLVGGGDAGILQYSAESDQWSTGKQLDYGQCNQLAAKRTGQAPFALTSITRTATGVTSLNGTPTAAGSGYNINDILTITTGGSGATARVLTVNSSGGVLSVALETVGTGYTTGTGKATSVSPSGGTGCTLEIIAVDFTELAVTPLNHNFLIGDTVVISGASGTGASKFNGTYTIIGTPSVTQFSYCSIGDPGAATATIANSPSATQLVDCTKNWVVNEHVGKIVQLSAGGALGATGQQRRIISNTATTLVWTLSATAPVNGTTKYIIEDIKAFGVAQSMGAQVGGGAEGFATSGSTTSLTDTTKSWPINYWSRTVNRKLRIIEGTGVGNEIAITSNTGNTLYFATQTFAPDTTTRYVIMDSFGTATAGSTTTLTDSGQNWEPNCWVNRRVRFLTGTGAGNEYTITANTATQLTFATGTAPDTSTAYAILATNVKINGMSFDMIINSSDPTINSRYFYSFHGSGGTEVSRYNLNLEQWEQLPLVPMFEPLTTGSMYCYDGEGRIYFTKDATGRIFYLDIVKEIIVPSSTVPYGMSTAISGNRMEIVTTEDGLKYLYIMRHSATEMWRTLLFW